MFLYYFDMIYGSNLLTRCPVPVPVFCCLFVSEKLFWEVSRIALKIYGNDFQYETKTEPKAGLQGDPQAPYASQARPPLGRAWVPPGQVVHLLESPFRL